jgi:hypothetical protein
VPLVLLSAKTLLRGTYVTLVLLSCSLSPILDHVYPYVVAESTHFSQEFGYGVCEVHRRYLKELLISAINIYYIINKLIILVPNIH